MTGKKSPTPRRLLMLTHRAPFPPNRGDRIRSYNILRELAGSWDVSLACVNEEPVEQAHRQELQRLCEQVAIEEVGATRWLRAAGSAATGASLTEGLFHSKKLHNTVNAWSKAAPFDCVLVYCSSMLQYANRIDGVPIVTDLVDVDSEKWRELAIRFRRSWKHWVYSLEASRVHRLEQQAMKRSCAITLVSNAEAQIFKSEIGDAKPVFGIGNGVDVDYFSVGANREPQPPTDPLRIVFVGGLDYFPNVEGIGWFVDEVLPQLRIKMPCRLQLVGRRPNATITRLVDSHDDIELHADVADVRDYLGKADIVVAPLRIARGIQNKVLEAMSCGRPVVLSEEAATGVEGIDNEHFHIGHSAKEFTDHIIELAESASLRERTGQAARRLIENKYSWQSRLRPLVDLLDQVSQSDSIEVLAL